MSQFNIRFAFLIVIGCSAILTFQNCSGDGFSSPTTTTSGSDASTYAFKAGDDFSVDLIPFAVADSELEAIRRYETLVGYKAIAFTAKGLMFLNYSTKPIISGQEEFNRMTLESCEVAFKGEPCSLFAEGDSIAQNKADFESNFVSVVTIPQTFDANLIPGLEDYWRASISNSYPQFQQGQFKAYAIGLRNTNVGFSRSSQSEANRRALELCETLTENQTCTLYAEGMNVIFNIFDFQWEPQRVFYGPRQFVAAQIPFVSDQARSNIASEYNQAMANGEQFALAIDRWGYTSRVSANQLSQADLDSLVDSCTLKLSPAEQSKRSCVLYSVDDEVVFSRQDFVDNQL